MIPYPRKIVDLRAGGAHSNTGLSLKQAYSGLQLLDPRIESLMLILFAIPYRLA